MNRAFRSGLIGLGGLAATLAGALAYETYRIRRPAAGNPAQFRLQGGRAEGQQVAVVLGASTVHGTISVDFVELLRRRWPAERMAFVNAGVNGDLAYSARQRLPDVIACDPDFVIVLVGTNDVQSTLNPSTRRLAMRSRGLPCEPTLAWYRENLTSIVADLHRATRARVALASLPVLGEDLSSPANARVREFNAAIREVAEAGGATYLPVHERQSELLARLLADHGRAFAGTPGLVVAAGVQHYLLGQSLDAISRRNGLVLTTDLMHMNSQGAALIAAEAEAFLCAASENKLERCSDQEPSPAGS